MPDDRLHMCCRVVESSSRGSRGIGVRQMTPIRQMQRYRAGMTDLLARSVAMTQ